MIRDMLSIEHTLSMFEQVLHINPTCADIAQQVVISRHAIESDIFEQIPEGKTIYSLEGHDKVDDFLGSCVECLKTFSLLVCLESFDLKFSQTLKSLNYIGASSIELLNTFRILAKQDLQHNRFAFMNDIIQAFSAIKTGEVRRVICIIAVLENIGMLDGVAILAEHIVLGGHQ